MTLYTVHVYREMKLKFMEIEAETPEAAAQIACELPHRLVDGIDECDGETFAALVDVYGDEEYEQSCWIDIKGEREIKDATPPAKSDAYTYRLGGRDGTFDLIDIVNPWGVVISCLHYWDDPNSDERAKAEASANVICDQLNRWWVGC